MPLQERVAIATGAASGIGKAAAIRLAGEGARAACLDEAFALDRRNGYRSIRLASGRKHR